MMREFPWGELLDRPEVQFDEAALRSALGGRRLLVTGAGGSVGTALAETLAAFGPAELVLLESHEPSLFHLRGLGLLPEQLCKETPRSICAQMLGSIGNYGADDDVRLLANANDVGLYGGNGGNEPTHGKPLRLAWKKENGLRNHRATAPQPWGFTGLCTIQVATS
jgi:threonine dehydrogenase-like Zn-dependent dehydrogenase